jgi:uncharacterized membrane protein
MDAQNTKTIRPEYWIFGILLLFMACLSAWAWNKIPDAAHLPVHWGLNGPDRYAGKFEGLLILPLLGAVFPILYIVAPLIDPRKFNLEKSRKAFSISLLSAVVFIAIIHSFMIAGALGRTQNVSLVMPVLVGLLFMVLGNYMGKIKSNFFLGFRTPWTLSSDLSWNKTHRLAGWIFVLFGLCLAAAAFSTNTMLLSSVFAGGLAAALVIPTVYSYAIWKRDPARRKN